MKNEIYLGAFRSTHKNYKNIVSLDDDTGLWKEYAVKCTEGANYGSISNNIPLEICSIAGIGDIVYAGNDTDTDVINGVASAYYSGSSYFKNRCVFTKVPNSIDIECGDGYDKHRYFLYCLKKWFESWWNGYHEHEKEFLHGGRINIITSIKDQRMLNILYHFMSDKHFNIIVVDNIDGKIKFVYTINNFYWKDHAKLAGYSDYSLASSEPLF